MRRVLVAALVLLVAIGVASGCRSPPTQPEATGSIARDRAAGRGLEWLAGYLADADHAADLGWDAVQVFAEPGWTSADQRQRAFGVQHAGVQARRLADRLPASRGSLTNDDRFDLLALAVDAEVLGLDPRLLRKRAREGLEGLAHPDEVFGLGVPADEKLEVAWKGQFIELLLGVYYVERARVAGVWSGPGLRLAEVLAFVQGRELLTRAQDPRPDKETFRDDVYLATHVAYVLCEYGRVRLYREDAPWVYDYLERVFPDLLASRDVELVAEVVDVYRCLGLDEARSPLMKEGTRLLMAAQNPDGSWGRPEAESEPYRAIHHTWCVTNALRERRLPADSRWLRHIRARRGLTGLDPREF